MTPRTLTLITGGSRSGKSRMALEKVSSYRRKIFLATAVATDPEMERRIERHQKERGPEFLTLEEPLHLAQAIRSHASSTDVILVDCLTFWLNNLFYDSPSPQPRMDEIKDFLRVLDERPTSLILVTNEINMGVIPSDPISREFVDRQGWLNQEAARRCDEVILMVAGIPLSLRAKRSNLAGSGEAPQFAEIASPAFGGPAMTIKDTFKIWQKRLQAIPPLDPAWRERARVRLREQTRPEGSLGELEPCLERLVAIQQKEKPSVSKKRIVVFAGDHGVEREGVSLYPREVTPAMVYNFLSGRATINAFARSVGVEVQVVDVGVDHEFDTGGAPFIAPLHSRKIRRGTSNIRETQAMASGELLEALEAGWEMALQAKRDGVELLGVGEMGIGNTTAASAVISALTKSRPGPMTGRGTGIDEASLQHKIQVIEEALRVNRPFLDDPFSILQSVGGFEIAAIAGCVVGAASQGIPCVVDGWITAAGALAMIQLNPTILDYLFFAHESEERGHRILLEELNTRPLLKLSMRLGEGTGACLAMGILDAAVRAYNEVATFGEAKVAKAPANCCPGTTIRPDP